MKRFPLITIVLVIVFLIIYLINTRYRKDSRHLVGMTLFFFVVASLLLSLISTIILMTSGIGTIDTSYEISLQPLAVNYTNDTSGDVYAVLNTRRGYYTVQPVGSLTDIDLIENNVTVCYDTSNYIVVKNRKFKYDVLDYLFIGDMKILVDCYDLHISNTPYIRS